MKQDEILKMCRSLARKYNDKQEYDDLVSEGMLKVYEMLEEGKTDKRLLYSHAQAVMNEYYNLGRLPVKVPKSHKAKAMSADDDVGNWTETAMHNALYGETVEIEEHTLQVPSTEELFERKEFTEYVYKQAKSLLCEEEFELIFMRYWEDMTQQEVAEVLQISQQAVLKREKMVLYKLFRLLNPE